MDEDSTHWEQKVCLFMPEKTLGASAVPLLKEARGLPVSIVDAADAAQFAQEGFVLNYVEERWQLFPPSQNTVFGRHALSIDFVNNPRFSQPMTLREPLSKAVGLRANRRPVVIDLTAGLGRDAWALASTGCRVYAFERHPLIHFLLQDGLRRARVAEKTSAIAARIHLHHCDARTQLPQCLSLDEHLVWLMDPMFPERQKTALVKKDMRIFHALVGADTDADDLFDWAQQQPANRYVIKRPPHAPALMGAKPSMCISSARVRFDCYLKPRPTGG